MNSTALFFSSPGKGSRSDEKCDYRQKGCRRLCSSLRTHTLILNNDMNLGLPFQLMRHGKKKKKVGFQQISRLLYG